VTFDALDALDALDASALLLELPEVESEVPDLAWPGVTVTVEPSGIVVLPLSPFGPVVTLLDIAPDGGTARRADLASRSMPAADVDDAELADAAPDDVPFASAQDRLMWRSADAPWARDGGKTAAAQTTAPSDTSPRGRKVLRCMGLTPPEWPLPV
jgi:hypothetical protein